MSSLKKIKFHYRKIIHYALLVSVISLQLIATVIWYYQSVSNKDLSLALNSMKSTQELQQLTNKFNASIINSQKFFNNYKNSKDKTSLEKYINSLKDIKILAKDLNAAGKSYKFLNNLIAQKSKTESDISALEISIDSIISIQTGLHNDQNLENFKFQRIQFQKTLDSLKTDTYMMVDSVSKKGLFSRLSDAISGKVVIQKEQLNTVVTMKYMDKVSTGSIEDQIKNVVLTTDKYYENEFNNLKNTILALKGHDRKLTALNNELLNFSYSVLPKYNYALKLHQGDLQNKLLNHQKSSITGKNYTIIILILIMLFISLILFNFTRIAFEYERRLTRAQEQIHQSLDFKNKIIGMISHEIRSPLNIISIYSRKIKSSIKDDEIKATFNSIQFTTDSLMHLANQILEYSKDENYQPVLKCKEFNLRDEIHQIVSSLASFVETKGNRIEMKCNMNKESNVYSDASKIHQLFYNIIGNANKFTDNEVISITVDLDDISDYEQNLKVEVRDNGIGITENDLKRIFDPYFQGSSSEKINDLGLGLGLSLCREIVSLFDGEITLESEQSKGTTVKFNLTLSKI